MVCCRLVAGLTVCPQCPQVAIPTSRYLRVRPFTVNLSRSGFSMMVFTDWYMSSVTMGGQSVVGWSWPSFSMSAAFLGASRVRASLLFRHCAPVVVVMPCLFHCCIMEWQEMPARTFS